MATTEEVATAALKFFVVKKPRKKSIWTFKDSAPQWLKDLVREAHETMMPDDYKFEYVVESLDLLAEGQDPDDYPQFEADVYNHDLLEWLGSNLERAGFVDEGVKEMGHGDLGIMGDIMIGQVHEKAQVWGVISQGIKARAEEESNEE